MFLFLTSDTDEYITPCGMCRQVIREVSFFYGVFTCRNFGFKF